MAEHGDNEIETKHESIMEKIHRTDSSSAEEDFDSEKKVKYNDDDDDLRKETEMKSKRKWLFGREKPVHEVFGGGKSADIFLWRNKKISASVLVGATALWALFELLEYHLVTLVSHGLIFVFSVLFLWSATSKFINKSPPSIPEVRIPEDKVIQVAAAIRSDINYSLGMLRDIASGRDLKKFLSVVAGLWVLSVIGAWCDFLTLFYTTFVVLHTVPVLYEKYEDEVDAFAEKAMIEFKKQYAVFDQKVLSKILSKIPKRPLKDKKTA